MKLRVSGLVKNYGPQRALDGLTLDLPEGTRCLALIGPSGGGKSTLLRHLGGLELPDGGSIEVNGKFLPAGETELRRYRRKNGFLFQGYNLFPHLTARQNIVLPLVEVHGKTPAEANNLAVANLERFGLAPHAEKLPVQLSGGQQQRVALIRSLVAAPEGSGSYLPVAWGLSTERDRSGNEVRFSYLGSNADSETRYLPSRISYTYNN